MNITGIHQFKIWKEGDWYLARVIDNEGNKFVTQGRTEEEIFNMIADCYLTVYEIPISRWKRLLHKLFRV